MRITFLCPHVRIAGGVRAILSHADRLAGRGHDVTVVVPAKGRWSALWRSFTGARPRWMPGLRARIHWVQNWEARRSPDADILVATAWQSAPVVAEAPARCGAKFYFVQHYESLYHGRPDVVDATYRLPLQKIVISTWLRDVMRARFGQDAETIVTPVDPALFHPVPVDVATSRPRVLMLHHHYEWKGVADGLDAIARARGRVSGLRLIGFGVERPGRALPYDEFHANPPQERLASLYSSADVYLCPSWDEGLGMPSMEAMACGAALVTYDNGGCRDYATHGQTALVARRRDVADLGEQLEQLAGDEALRAKLGPAGFGFVRETFDWDDAVTRMEAMFADARRRR